METINFSKCNKDIIKNKLGLKRVDDSIDLTTWLEKSKTVEITDIENFMINKYQKMMIQRVEEWNEFELSQHFLGPIMALVDFNTEYFSMFAERILEVQTEKFTISGKADFMVASGEKEPISPYFCMQEYKQQSDPNGNPLYQVISEMYAAQQKNNTNMPIYGISIIGIKWQFIVLQNTEYCISYSYSADSPQIYEIFKILKALKNILIENVK